MVLDEQGRGVPDAQLRIEKRPVCVAKSALNGRFVFAQPVAPGKMILRVDCLGWAAPGDGIQLVIGDGESVKEVVVTVTALPSVVGRVVTTDGRPAEGYRITHEPPAAGHRSRATADMTGGFVLYAPSPTELTPIKLVAEHCGRFGLMVADVNTRWGERGVEIVVRSATQVDLMVVSQENSTPVPAYRLFVSSMLHADLVGQLLNAPYRLVRDDHGVAVLHLLPGLTYISIFPDVEGLLPTIVSLDVAEEGPSVPLRVALSQSEPITLRAVDVQNAVVGAKVVAAVLAPGGDRKLPDARLPRWDLTTGSPIPSLIDFGVVDQAITDASGRATITFPRSNRVTLQLQVSAEGYLPLTLEMAIEDLITSKEVTCQMQRSPRVTLTFAPAAIHPFQPAVRVVGRPGKTWLKMDPEEKRVVLQGLAPGRYALDVSFAAFPGVLLHPAVVAFDVGTQDSTVELDLSQFVPTRLSGIALIDGRPAGKVRLHKRREGRVDRPWSAEVLTDNAGAFEFPTLPVGSFGLSCPAGTIPLVAGWQSDLGGIVDGYARMDFRTRDVEFTVTDADGKPLDAGELLWVSCDHEPLMTSQLATGLGGTVRLERIAAERAVVVEVVQGARQGSQGIETPIGAKRISLKRD